MVLNSSLILVNFVVVASVGLVKTSYSLVEVSSFGVKITCLTFLGSDPSVGFDIFSTVSVIYSLSLSDISSIKVDVSSVVSSIGSTPIGFLVGSVVGSFITLVMKSKLLNFFENFFYRSTWYIYI